MAFFSMLCISTPARHSQFSVCAPCLLSAVLLFKISTDPTQNQGVSAQYRCTILLAGSCIVDQNIQRFVLPFRVYWIHTLQYHGRVFLPRVGILNLAFVHLCLFVAVLLFKISTDPLEQFPIDATNVSTLNPEQLVSSLCYCSWAFCGRNERQLLITFAALSFGFRGVALC